MSLQNTSTKDLLNMTDPDVAYDNLDNMITKAINLATEEVKPKVKPDKKWFDSELRKLRHKRQRIYKTFLRNNGFNDFFADVPKAYHVRRGFPKAT